MTSDGIVVTLPVGRQCVQAASLKRPAVTESVPLRWQSRMVALSSLRDHGSDSNNGRNSSVRATTRTGRRRWRRRSKPGDVAENNLVSARQKQTSEKMKHTSKQKKKTQGADKRLGERIDECGEEGGESDRRTESNRIARGWSSGIDGDASATIVASIPAGARPSTAPMHTDGKVAMRRLGSDSHDAPSVVFEPGFSRLRTRRVILDRWVRLHGLR